MTELYDQILAAGPLDWLALITSLAYVWLAARDNNWCWLFAAVSTAVWAWQSFVVYQLVSDGFLQLFYLVMAGVGIWRWTRVKLGTQARESKAGLVEQGARRKEVLTRSAGRPQETPSQPSPRGRASENAPRFLAKQSQGSTVKPVLLQTPDIRNMTVLEHVYVLLFGLLGGWAMYMFVSGVFTSAATLPDALTTAFSIATTFLLVWRRLENWLYWIVIDAVYVWIYFNTGAVLFALMMVINIGMAIYGYLNWRREMRAANTI